MALALGRLSAGGWWAGATRGATMWGETVAHWMNVPELEAMLQEINDRPADMDALRAAIAAIAERLDRKVKTVDRKSVMVTFQSPGLTFYNVAVEDDEYRVLFQHEAAQLDLRFGYTADLAWRICGYPCSPADMREIKVRAEREGVEDLKKIPPRYFRPRRRPKPDDRA
jgi:hypothetical protein